eukprot:CAMPEP_0119293194 /NCGR_PEP_ID=MMETSP1329-20130426/45603_1 /TAXON_ID=114041 /ORGANISM="Genus nov. species nov., Strain RCC1024" /LENGTH=374 /DNA_ID=CAMNT_0007294057 /DNA_START=190 /DNA_END=1311 /DNA_ORIENTATION=-
MLARNAAALSGPRAWWQRIGAPKYVCAPMVDQSGLAFRSLVRKYGADYAYTPMIHAGVASGRTGGGEQYLDRHFQTDAEDGPLCVQVAGSDPDECCRAAELVLARAGEHAKNVAQLDVNLGCPQNIARKGLYGAWLLERDVDAAASVVRALDERFCDGVHRIASCKVRLLPDDAGLVKTIDHCRRLVDAGAGLICVHGRTRLQNKQLSGAASWEAIRTVREALDPGIVVIANGGIGDFEDLERCREATGADAVMASEGLLANPALFCRNIDASGAYVGARRLAREYLALAGATGAHPADIRGHVFKLLHGGLKALPVARHALSTASDLKAVAAVVDMLDLADPLGALEAQHHTPAFSADASWYWRHRVATAEAP